jgi:DNA-binding transcriptional MocR family regulator
MWKPQLPDDSREPLFRRIVQAMADDIASGRLVAGTRLPPHRDLADELVIARGTVARAYREAERLGLLRSQVGRGTSVLAPDDGERAYSSLLEAPTVLRDLSTNSPLSGIDPDPAEVLRRLAERPDRKALLRYHPPAGVRRHRLAGVQWLARMDVEASVEDVVLCAGAQHALFVVLSHLAPRAPVLYVEELTYPGIHGVAEALR